MCRQKTQNIWSTADLNSNPLASYSVFTWDIVSSFYLYGHLYGHVIFVTIYGVSWAFITFEVRRLFIYTIVSTESIFPIEFRWLYACFYVCVYSIYARWLYKPYMPSMYRAFIRVKPIIVYFSRGKPPIFKPFWLYI